MCDLSDNNSNLSTSDEESSQEDFINKLIKIKMFMQKGITNFDKIISLNENPQIKSKIFELGNKNCEILHSLFENDITDRDQLEGIENKNYELEKKINKLEIETNIFNNNAQRPRKVLPNKEFKIPIIGQMKKGILSSNNKCKEEICAEYTSFSAINQNQNLILGKKNGEIEIFDFNQNTNLWQNEKKESEMKIKLRLKAFYNEVKVICELDEDLFAVSNNKIIKIINIKENSPILQTLNIDDYNNYLELNICSMIPLPSLGSKNNCYFLAVATDLHIFIYKSSKHNLHFEIYKVLEIDTLTACLIEEDDNLIAACPDKKEIKYFDMTNNFKETKVDEIPVTNGSNVLSIMTSQKSLIVACTDGFKILSNKRKKKVKSVHCRYSVLSLDMISDNNLVCCCSENNKNVIKQYEINKEDYTLGKKSQIALCNNDEIWRLKKIDERIFFLDDQKRVNYFFNSSDK